MKILEGKALSQSIIDSLNFPPNISLHVILVGDNPASIKYVSLKQKKCEEKNINFTLHHLPENTPESELVSLINQLNNDPKVTGYFIQLPIKNNELLNLISPQKDVDGLTENSQFVPAVDVGVMALLKSTNVKLAGKNAVIINDSKLIGIPLKKLLTEQGVNVTIANKFTQNLAEISRGADLLISATGQKGLITSEYIKQGAIVVDIGGGDVDFENIKEKCSFITPPTGSVGPMTIACLLQNLLLATSHS